MPPPGTIGSPRTSMNLGSATASNLMIQIPRSSVPHLRILTHGLQWAHGPGGLQSPVVDDGHLSSNPPQTRETGESAQLGAEGDCQVPKHHHDRLHHKARRSKMNLCTGGVGLKVNPRNLQVQLHTIPPFPCRRVILTSRPSRGLSSGLFCMQSELPICTNCCRCSCSLLPESSDPEEDATVL